MGGKRRPLVERFWAKVDKNGPLPKYAPFLGPCWLWMASTPNGYGQIAAGNGAPPIRAHRLSYELHNGPIPEGLVLDHLCQVTRCVNPSHLEPVSLGENFKRRVKPNGSDINRVKTHCKNGHPFNDENTYIFTRKEGGQMRQCKLCHRDHARAHGRRERSAETLAKREAP